MLHDGLLTDNKNLLKLSPVLWALTNMALIFVFQKATNWDT